MTDLADAYEIFLSYARVDNEKETEDKAERGWVDHFQSRLLKQLRRRGRADVGFWRDVAEISGTDRFGPEISKGLAESWFFLPVISPTYIQRPWCQEELSKFAGRQADEPEIERRIVPVHKLPLDPQLIPDLIRGRGGYHFYQHDPVAKSVLEYYRRGQVQDEDAYADLLDQITDYICANLPEVAAYSEIVNPPAASDVVTVFVANSADDMFPAYDKLVTELKSQGFRVVLDPGQELPKDSGAAVVAVDEAMEQAQLVVHLLGADAGPRRGGGTRLVDLLLDQTRAGPVPRLIWAPATLFNDPTCPEASVREHGRDAFEVLATFGDFRDGDTVTDAPFEAFLQDLVRRCHGLRSPVPAGPAGGAADAPSVYVVGAEDDASLVHQVTGTLIEEHGLNAYPCGFQGAPDEIRRLHEEEMRDSDAVLYCWGQASDTWLRSYTREARFVARFGRENPFRATAIVLGPPFSDYKQSFRSADVSLHLGQAEAITAELFTPLVAALGAKSTNPLTEVH